MTTTEQIHIRAIDPSEWKEYRAIRLRALEDSPDAFGSIYADSVLYPDQFWIEKLEAVKPSTEFPMFASKANQIVGLAWAEIEVEDTGATAHLYSMWVESSSRGNGIGEKLISAAIDWARKNAAKKVVLEVTNGDRPARRLYDRLGFQPVGELLPVREGSDLLEQTMVLGLHDGGV